MTASITPTATARRPTTAVLWVAAVLLTLGLAAYQRMTGPTRPLRGSLDLAGAEVGFTLRRTHGGTGEQEVRVHAPAADITGELQWHYYPGDHPWTRSQLQREGESLVGHLPHQPPAGKIEYGLRLQREEHSVAVPTDQAAVITRFKGAVTPWFLVPHIIAMFGAMLVSNRAGMEAVRSRPSSLGRYTLVATVLLALGGMLLGPLVQLQAFGQLWTGVPFGTDLTDNKTLVAMLGWLAALVACRGGRARRGWVLLASLLLLVIFLIPHSMFGSELQR